MSEHVWWAPRLRTWWIGVLFALGATCFLVGPWPAYLQWVGPQVDAGTFFVGSIFFTTAATLQWLQARAGGEAPGAPAARARGAHSWDTHRLDLWSCGTQLVGTLFFNVSTFRGLSTALSSPSYDRLVWRPDALGSICFLVSGYLACLGLTGRWFGRPPRTAEGRIALVNLAGCVAFGVSALADYVLSGTGSPADITVANSATALGAACFLVGALLLVPTSARTEPSLS